MVNVSNEEAVQFLKENILRREDVMRVLKISKVTLWKWMRNGALRSYNLCGTVYFLKDELLEDIRRNNVMRKRMANGKEES